MNRIWLIGNSGRDPEVKNFDNGKLVTLTLATTERGYTLKNGTQVPEHTDWHRLVVRGGLADVVEKFVKKGTKIAVVGKMRYREYEADGRTQTVPEVVVEDMELLSPKDGGQEAQKGGERKEEQFRGPTPQSGMEDAGRGRAKEDDLPF